MFLALCSPAIGQQRRFTRDLPFPYGEAPKIDPELEDLEWHTWKTKNFVVCSIDYKQSAYLANNIEPMKKWLLDRWGLPNVDFGSECIVCCVPNRELLEKIFKINSSHGEVTCDANGKIIRSKLWLVLDDSPNNTIPIPLTLVCMKELEEQSGVNLGHWVHRGMGLLNGTPEQIKSVMNSRSFKTTFFDTKKLFETTPEEWVKLSNDDRNSFDKEAAMVCLLLRKELGQDNFVKFLLSGANEKALVKVYGYSGHREFISKVKRYMEALSQDIFNRITPDDYLTVKAKRR